MNNVLDRTILSSIKYLNIQIRLEKSKKMNWNQWIDYSVIEGIES